MIISHSVLKFPYRGSLVLRSVNVHEERVLVEGVEVQLDSRYIANDLEHKTTEHSSKKAPGTIADAEAYL